MQLRVSKIIIFHLETPGNMFVTFLEVKFVKFLLATEINCTTDHADIFNSTIGMVLW